MSRIGFLAVVDKLVDRAFEAHHEFLECSYLEGVCEVCFQGSNHRVHKISQDSCGQSENGQHTVSSLVGHSVGSEDMLHQQPPVTPDRVKPWQEAPAGTTGEVSTSESGDYASPDSLQSTYKPPVLFASALGCPMDDFQHDIRTQLESVTPVTVGAPEAPAQLAGSPDTAGLPFTCHWCGEDKPESEDSGDLCTLPIDHTENGMICKGCAKVHREDCECMQPYDRSSDYETGLEMERNR